MNDWGDTEVGPNDGFVALNAVQNTTDAEIGPVSLTVTVPEGASASISTADQVCDSGTAQTVTCDLGVISPGGIAFVGVVVLPDSGLADTVDFSISLVAG